VTEASFSWSAANLTLRVEAATGSYTGAPPTRASALHVRGWGRTRDPPTAVLFNGSPVSHGNSTPGWSIISAQPGEPALTAPDGMLQVRIGALALNAPFDIAVLF
jgi:hypothetical protein